MENTSDHRPVIRSLLGALNAERCGDLPAVERELGAAVAGLSGLDMPTLDKLRELARWVSHAEHEAGREAATIGRFFHAVAGARVRALEAAQQAPEAGPTILDP